MWSPKESILVDTVYQHSVPHANSWRNEFRSWRWKEVVNLKVCQCTVVVVMFETWFSILDYCLSSVPEFCLPGVTLMLCFKVVLTVALLSWLGKTAKSLFIFLFFSFRLLLRWSMGNITWLVTESQRYDSSHGHITMKSQFTVTACDKEVSWWTWGL